jgi:hypothetical protein
MQKVLNNIKDEHLRAYIIWLPGLPSDDRDWAAKRTREFSDDRVMYYWDAKHITGDIWRDVLGIKRMAWDIYFLYSASSRWEKKPKVPDFWAHQLGGVTKVPPLNEEEFEKKTNELLQNINNENE